MKKRTILISDSHLYSSAVRVGAHHYANIFARNGWKVFFLSSSFNLARLFLPKNELVKEYVRLWKNNGIKDVNTGIEYYCLAHILPTRFRYNRFFKSISARLYFPQINALLSSRGVDELDVLWLNGNGDWLYRNAVKHRKLVVRIVDNYEGYDKKFIRFNRISSETLKKADCVIACSKYVKDLFQKIRNDIRVVPNGVEYDLFSKKNYEEPNFLHYIPRPRIVYIGAVAKWFNQELLLQLVKFKPELSFIIVGATKEDFIDPIKKLKNIYFLGKKPYDFIPNILAYSDVGIVLFKKGALVDGVSPIKVYEYLAAGLPVVATKWKELEDSKLPIILGNNVEELVIGIENALKCTPKHKEKLQEYSSKCSWQHRLEDILQYAGIQL